MEKYSVVDLFAGAGGLSLGFLQTGRFDIKVAFENNPDMQATYKKNHPGVEVLGDVCQADYSAMKDKYGDIDVVIGGPPCQGFSNANRQKNHAVSMNNMLVKQYIRAILELNPKAFVMENVSMLKSDVHRFYMTRSDIDCVRKYKISTKETRLLLLEKKYLFEGAADIVSSPFRIASYLWPEEHYQLLNVIYKATKNIKKLKKALVKHQSALLRIADKHISDSSDYILSHDSVAFSAVKEYFLTDIADENDYFAQTLRESIECSVMIQRMLGKAQEIFANDIIVEDYSETDDLTAAIRSFAVYDYLTSILQSEDNGYVIDHKVLCAADYGAPQKRNRFVVMGVKKELASKIALPSPEMDEDEYKTVRDAIEDIEDVEPVTEVSDDIGIVLNEKDVDGLAGSLRDSERLYNHVITKTTATAMERFKAIKQGENFHSLDDALKTNTYTDVSRTQNTIYLRLNYDEPSGTVVNVRKSMWIHPVKNRAVSIREAARLQTFPDSFIFCGTKDKQYQQVGNAVPPIMAKAIANKLCRYLSK